MSKPVIMKVRPVRTKSHVLPRPVTTIQFIRVDRGTIYGKDLRLGPNAPTVQFPLTSWTLVE